ncbi:hypothetical protein DQ04_02101170 [Trypanosoma grayi]|uniref:hypothetical protein n=1 Tax=Trypanosoma grayi TaxID=71804 RepID=UPI0004F49C79|nr:hypothetical protein DQ04_02101170 [Trypanosoma grayi]KEG11983.1 hypothetical protein DQ04_02101170 [Trypanosoma grayi]
MECRFCFSDGKVENVRGFNACGRCAGKVVPLCEGVVHQVSGPLVAKGWGVEVITDENEWRAALSSAVSEYEMNDEGRKAILFAIQCKKGDVTTLTFIDRMSVLAAMSAALSRLMTAPRSRDKRNLPKRNL